jgi:hypothetical protein
VEIHQKAEGGVQKTHVTQQLSYMDWQDLLYGLGFDDEAAIDVEIQAQWLFECQIFIGDRDNEFTNRWNFAECKFMHQASLVDAFQQSGTLVPVNFDRSSDDLRRPSVCAIEIRMHAELPDLSGLPVPGGCFSSRKAVSED